MSPSLVCHCSFPVFGVDRDEVVVERGEEDLAVIVGETPRDHVAARFAGGRRVRFRRV
jgi:hypothetical protein